MTNRPQLYVLLAHLVMGVGVVVAATVLGALHDLDPQAVVAIFATAIGLVGGSAAALGSLASAVNGKSVVSQGTLDAAMAALATSTPPAPPAEPARTPPV